MVIPPRAKLLFGHELRGKLRFASSPLAERETESFAGGVPKAEFGHEGRHHRRPSWTQSNAPNCSAAPGLSASETLFDESPSILSNSLRTRLYALSNSSALPCRLRRWLENTLHVSSTSLKRDANAWSKTRTCRTLRSTDRLNPHFEKFNLVRQQERCKRLVHLDWCSASTTHILR